jgi:hypothetical protein
MILGGLEAASPLHRFALAVTKWIGLEAANQGVSSTYPLWADALALTKCLENRVGGKQGVQVVRKEPMAKLRSKRFESRSIKPKQSVGTAQPEDTVIGLC